MKPERPKHRLSIDSSLTAGVAVRLGPEQAMQVNRVLRLRAGDLVVLFNGDGFDYVAVLGREQEAVVAQPTGERYRGRFWGSPDIHLGMALTKADRFDLAVQKAVELGVHSITPIQSARCVVTLPVDRAGARVARWRRIVREAMEQSGRADRVDVTLPVSFPQFLENARADQRFIAWERERCRSLAHRLGRSGRTLAMLIGPEGGFEDDEVELAEASGFEPVSLGPTVLRSETAAIFALATIRARTVAADQHHSQNEGSEQRCP